jgi:hypothetical protein
LLFLALFFSSLFNIQETSPQKAIDTITIINNIVLPRSIFGREGKLPELSQLITFSPPASSTSLNQISSEPHLGQVEGCFSLDKSPLL